MSSEFYLNIVLHCAPGVYTSVPYKWYALPSRKYIHRCKDRPTSDYDELVFVEHRYRYELWRCRICDQILVVCIDREADEQTDDLFNGKSKCEGCQDRPNLFLIDHMLHDRCPTLVFEIACRWAARIQRNATDTHSRQNLQKLGLTVLTRLVERLRIH